MRPLAVAVLAFLVGIVAYAASPAPITGPAFVIDGDTLDVAGVRVRLWGIDAPEAAQSCFDDKNQRYSCGSLATDVLVEEIGMADVTCQKQDTDRYGRVVAICFVHGHDLGARMVQRGFALDYEHYSGGKYRAEQEEAAKAKRGIWIGRFDQPWDWRWQNRGRMR